MTLNDDDVKTVDRQLPINETAVIAAIEALMPNEKQRRADLFSKAMPAILAAEQRGVSRSKIMQALKEQGLQLSIGGYNALRQRFGTERSDDAGNGNTDDS